MQTKYSTLTNEQKKYIQWGVIGLVIVLIVTAFLMLRTPKQKTSKIKAQILPENEAIALVDSSVKVEFSSQNKREAAISVDKLPSGTEQIEYEISYNTSEDVPQGAIGTLNIDGDKASKSDITFGTCSSGTCRYHNIVGDVRLILKFTGSYGDRLFEKEYSL